MLLTGALLGIAACGGEGPRERTDFTRTPIVFVHGSGLSSLTWRELQRELERSGYPREYLEAIDIPPQGSANDAAARDSVSRAVDRLLTRAGEQARRHDAAAPAKVDLVAHSMGAVSTRYYAALVHPERVRLWLGIAGPNHGTNALCGSELPGDRQMCPAFAASAHESPLQAQLNGTSRVPRDPSPYGIGRDAGPPVVRKTAERCIGYYTIRIEPDEWIAPAHSAKLAGAGGLNVALESLPAVETEPGNLLFTASIDHDHLPSHPQLIELVERILAAADRDLPPKCGQDG